MANPIDEMLSSVRTPSPDQNGSNASTNEQKARELIAAHNGDGRAAFFDLCKERGLDPVSIITRFVGGK